MRSLSHHIEHGLAGTAIFQPVHAVLRHHDGTVDNGTEVNRAQTHQVNRNSEQVHPDEAEEQRERNGNGHHKGSAPVPKEDKQDDHNEHGQLQ